MDFTQTPSFSERSSNKPSSDLRNAAMQSFDIPFLSRYIVGWLEPIRLAISPSDNPKSDIFLIISWLLCSIWTVYTQMNRYVNAQMDNILHSFIHWRIVKQ